MFALYKKEISAFLNTLIGYIIFLVFLLISSLFLWVFPTEFNILDYGYAQLDGFFMLAPIVFLFLIPAISMRLFSEEKKTGTLELLFTRPLNDWQIVGAKYLAALSLVAIVLLPSLIYVGTLYYYSFPTGNIDLGIICGSYLGLLLLAAVFSAIGIFSSAITDNQIVAFLISLFISAFFYQGFEIIYSLDLFGNLDLLVQNLGIYSHYSSIRRGVVDIRDLVYFFSVIGLFLLFTHTILSRRKW